MLLVHSQEDSNIWNDHGAPNNITISTFSNMKCSSKFLLRNALFLEEQTLLLSYNIHLCCCCSAAVIPLLLLP